MSEPWPRARFWGAQALTAIMAYGGSGVARQTKHLLVQCWVWEDTQHTRTCKVVVLLSHDEPATLAIADIYVP